MTQRLTNHRWALGFAFLLLLGWPRDAWTQEIVELGDRSANCHEDAACINRLHPAIPMAARAQPGATIVLHTRNASDFDLDPNAPPDPRDGDSGVGTVHSLTGPVYIEGAQPGDVLKVRILDIAPGPWAYTLIAPIGFISDQIKGPLRVLWRLNRDYAVSDDLPGVRIPNRSFPGVVTVLPPLINSRSALFRCAGVTFLSRSMFCNTTRVLHDCNWEPSFRNAGAFRFLRLAMISKLPW